jgi:hypothetical protein
MGPWSRVAGRAWSLPIRFGSSRKIDEQAIAGKQRKSLKEIKTDLGTGYFYGEIKLVLAHCDRA